MLCKPDCKQAKNKQLIMNSSHFPCPNITITGVGVLKKETSVRIYLLMLLVLRL